jgi:hypothetical protein
MKHNPTAQCYSEEKLRAIARKDSMWPAFRKAPRNFRTPTALRQSPEAQTSSCGRTMLFHCVRKPAKPFQGASSLIPRLAASACRLQNSIGHFSGSRSRVSRGNTKCRFGSQPTVFRASAPQSWSASGPRRLTGYLIARDAKDNSNPRVTSPRFSPTTRT